MGDGISRPDFGSAAVPFDDGRLMIGRHGSGRRMSPQSPHEALQPEAAPPPPPKPPSRRRPTLSTLSGFLSFLVLVAIGALAAVLWGSNHLNEPGPLTADKIVFIERHTDSIDIINKLESEGVIDSKWLFQAMLVLQGKTGKIKSGEFHFKQHASMHTVMDILVNNKQFLHPFTVPEGLTSAQIVQRLRDNDLLSGEIREIPKDGILLPETYKFPRGWSRADILTKMQDDDRRAVEQIWARRSPDLPLRSPYELVTLASIVEKETGKADERSRVAGVFINRLQRHIRLQSDPTIVYGLVGGQGTLGHSITRSELDKKTAYNTYQIDGLPPGPIDNPGRAALEAVANPSRTQDLYFVADGSGGHAFSSSIEEHNRNVARWRQLERDAKDKDIDKVTPSAVAPPPGGKNQRSDASDPAFGILPTIIGTTSLGQLASFADPSANHDIAMLTAAEERGLVPPGPGHGKAGRVVDPTSMTASIDSMGFSLSGSQTTGSDMLDGPVSADPPQEAPVFSSTPVHAAATRAGPDEKPCGAIQPVDTPVARCNAERPSTSRPRRKTLRRSIARFRSFRRDRADALSHSSRGAATAALASQDLRRLRGNFARSAQGPRLRPQYRQDDPGRSRPLEQRRFCGLALGRIKLSRQCRPDRDRA